MVEELTHVQQENSSEERLTLAITNFLIIDRVGLPERKRERGQIQYGYSISKLSEDTDMNQGCLRCTNECCNVKKNLMIAHRLWDLKAGVICIITFSFFFIPVINRQGMFYEYFSVTRYLTLSQTFTLRGCIVQPHVKCEQSSKKKCSLWPHGTVIFVICSGISATCSESRTTHLNVFWS